MKSHKIEDGKVSELDSHFQQDGDPLMASALYGGASQTPRRSPRSHGWLIAAMALLGLSVGWLAGGINPASPTARIRTSPSIASQEKTDSQDLLVAKQRADAAKARLARAFREDGINSTLSTPTSGEMRVLALQEELVRAEGERDQRGPASEEETTATRHREDLLRIAYETQLETLSATEKKSANVRLLREEAALTDASYQHLKAHKENLDAQTEML